MRSPRSILSARMSHVQPSFTKAMTQRAAQLQASGKDVITLSQGELDFDTPAEISAAGVRAIEAGKTRYTAVAGISELRTEVAQRFAKAYGIEVSPEDVTVGCGAKQVLFNTLLASLDPGDEVIIPTPCWVSHPEMVRLAGGEPVLVDCADTAGFKLTASQLATAITPRTKWLLLNSPNNPTGAVYGREELEALAAVLFEHEHVWILCDDIYRQLVYDVRFESLVSVAPNLRSRCLIVDGVSKSHAMTGWRVGFGTGPSELIRAMNTVQGQTTSHTASVSQYAALAAVKSSPEPADHFREKLRARRDLLLERLSVIPGLKCIAPDGAFYVYVQCAELIGRRSPRGTLLSTDVDVAMSLLDAGVATVPGTGFLASPFFRLSFAASEGELAEACDRIETFCRAVLSG
jgi:aspartate aminotransferase